MADKNESAKERRLAAFALRIAGDIGGTIAIPVAILTWIGRRLDVFLETRPYMVVISICIAFVISVVAVCHKALNYGDQYRAITEAPDSDDIDVS
jgi:F0F1-type ATP synthase assembly protein I